MDATPCNSAYGQRSRRSSLTMLKYLARSGSESELNTVLQQNARCEGTLKEQRQRAGKLRSDQGLEAQLHGRIQLLASTLQADANAKAAARLHAAAAARNTLRVAEQAARVMGAVAPHRASARDAALAIVAPRDWQPVSPPRSPLRSEQMSRASRPCSLAAAGTEWQSHVSLRPGRYCLRSYATDSDALDDDNYFVAAGRGGSCLSLSSAEEAATAPWLVRQPAGTHACTFCCTNGTQLWASPTGELCLGAPPRAELGQFAMVHMIHYDGDLSGSSCDDDGGVGCLTRPFSSQSPRVSAAIHTALRPQTALPLGHGNDVASTNASAKVSMAANTAAATAGPSGTPDDVQLVVRLFHRSSRRFLHVDRTSGRVSLEPEPPPGTVSSATISRGGARHRFRPPAHLLSFAFEVVLRHSRDVPKPGTSGVRMLLRTLPADAAAPPKILASGYGPCWPSTRGHAGGAYAAGQATNISRRTMGQMPATLPMRGFDMSTGTVARTAPRRPRPLFTSLQSEGLLPSAMNGVLDEGVMPGLAAAHPPWRVMNSVAAPVPTTASVAPASAYSSSGEGEYWHLATGTGDSSHATAGCALRSARGGQRPMSEAVSAWDASQIDLSDLLSQGPLLLRSLFASGSGASTAAAHAPCMAPSTQTHKAERHLQ